MPTRPEDLRLALFSEVFVPKIDGIVRVTCLLLEHLHRVGANVILFAPGKHPETYADYPVVSVPGMPFPLYRELTIGFPGRKAYRTLETFRPNLFHVLNPVSTGLQGMRFARHMKKPLIASFQAHAIRMAAFYGFGFAQGPMWWAHRILYNRADYRLAPSLTTIDELHAHHFKTVEHWKRGVDTEAFAPKYANDEVRRKLSNDQPDKVLLLSVGRLAAEKQVERLVGVLDAVPNAHLVIVGDGPYRATLEQAFAGRSVTFTGYMRGQALSEVYASCDIFVFPSSKIETFGLVALEGMASGLAIVSSRVGGVPELIEEGVNGYTFEPDDVPSLITQVKTLAEDPAKRKAMAQAAYETACRRSWTVVMDELFARYCAIVDEWAGR